MDDMDFMDEMDESEKLNSGGNGMTKNVETTEVTKRVDISDLTPYLEDREYNREVFITEIRQYLQMTIEGMLKVGNRLICMKMMEGHGKFLESLDEIGIAHQRANEFMAISYFVRNRILPKLPDAANLKRLDTMGKTRLLLLARIPDEILDQFEEENVLEKKIEEVEAMPIDQLRQEIRELREAKKNGMAQNRRLQEDKDKALAKVDALLGKGEDAGMKAAKTAADNLFEALLKVRAMIVNDDYRAIFDSPEKANLLRASEGAYYDLGRLWQEFGAAVKLPE